jgi:hypothetical protein
MQPNDLILLQHFEPVRGNRGRIRFIPRSWYVARITEPSDCDLPHDWWKYEVNGVEYSAPEFEGHNFLRGILLDREYYGLVIPVE